MKTINKIFGLISILLAFTACNEDPTYFQLPNQPDDMHIQASVPEVVLNKGQEGQPAITFKWDEVKSPIKDYDSITYSIRLYATESKSDNHTEFISIGKKREVTFTHKELNDIIARWVPAGTKLSVTAEVVGLINNEIKYIKPESSMVEFSVTGYEKTPMYLYAHLKDDATGAERVERLSQRQLGSGIYEGTFPVTPCSYYFTTSPTSDRPAYGQDSGEKLKFVNEGNVSNFTNTASGTRTFIVDINDEFMDCRVVNIVQLPTRETIRIVGDGCSIGWDPGSSEGLFKIENPRYPYIYSWTGEFKNGEIKVNTGTNWGDQFFFAPESNADPAVNHQLNMFRYEGAGGDVKWKVTTPGRFKFTLCLDTDNLHTSFEPVQ